VNGFGSIVAYGAAYFVFDGRQNTHAVIFNLSNPLIARLMNHRSLAWFSILRSFHASPFSPVVSAALVATDHDVMHLAIVSVHQYGPAMAAGVIDGVVAKHQCWRSSQDVANTRSVDDFQWLLDTGYHRCTWNFSF